VSLLLHRRARCVHPTATSKVRGKWRYFRPLPNGYWAVPPLGRGTNSYPKIPRAWWPKIADEYAAGMSGPTFAERWGVINSRAMYPILQRCEREQAPD